MGAHMQEQPSVERENIIQTLAASQAPMSITEIAEACHAKYDNVRVLIWKLKAEGFLEKVRRGWYKLADHRITYSSERLGGNHGNNGNIGNNGTGI
jgi:DNA-binding IclR family transcriptional regulator